MSNTGFFELTFLSTDGKPTSDPSTRVRFKDAITGSSYGAPTVEIAPTARFKLPAFPQSQRIEVQIEPERYRHRNIGFFTLPPNETVPFRATVFRNPKKWSASFIGYDHLAVDFDDLKRVLEISSNIRLKNGPLIGGLSGAAYDAVSEPKVVLAKAALLNLHFKLRVEPVEAPDDFLWFDFVREIVEVDRERFVAVADPAILPAVRAARDDGDDFPDYKKAPPGDHFKGYPKGYTVKMSSRLSVKTVENKGNLQVTAAEATDPSGNPVVLADFDIDENGALMAHLADLLSHKFSGGTHPFDIHEYIQFRYATDRLGYRLV